VWPGTLDEVMERLTERIVERYDDPGSWEYATWLNLTAAGQKASAEIVRKRKSE
jgi:hypothetical protein